jgi:deoxyribonuclease-4
MASKYYSIGYSTSLLGEKHSLLNLWNQIPAHFQIERNGYFIEPDEIEEINRQRASLLYPKTIVFHAPIMLNLACGWKSAVEKDFPGLQEDIRCIKDLPSVLVIHTGKYLKLSWEKARELITRHLNEFEIPRRMVFLENAAGQGTEMGCYSEEFRMIFEGLDQTKIGICFDTQHSFASGWCSFMPGAFEKILEELDSIGKHLIGVIHLNGSLKPFGSHVDRHQSFGPTECIWEGRPVRETTLINVLNFAREEEIPIVLETPDSGSDLLFLENGLRSY